MSKERPTRAQLAWARKVPKDSVCVGKLDRALEYTFAEIGALTEALTKISAIRDSMVGMQGFNFSEHGYPLVAALDGAGFKGAGYQIARENLGTLIDQRDAAEAARTTAENALAELRRVSGNVAAWLECQAPSPSAQCPCDACALRRVLGTTPNDRSK